MTMISVPVYCRSFPDGGYSHISFVNANLSDECYDSLRGAKAYEINGASPAESQVRQMLERLSVEWLPGVATGGTYDVRINGQPAAPEQWNPPPLR